jgi:hypothetical protein
MMKDIIYPTHHNIVFLHIKQDFLHLSVVDCGFPESTTLFRNPAAGADITAFNMSHYGEGYYLPDTSQYSVFTYKIGIFTFERGGLWVCFNPQPAPSAD